jgi:signal peptidase I
MRTILRLLMWTAIIAVVLIGAARSVAIRWWQVPINDPWLQASVEPSLRGGDWILLWRLTQPGFGDLVLCPEPNAPERVVIGRIIGEAGDKISIEGSAVSINGHLFPTERACSPHLVIVNHPRDGQPIEQQCQMEDLSGTLHPRASTAGQTETPQPVEAKVPEGYVFLVSDNRLFPLDSRDFGPIERKNCRESVIFRLWGLNGFYDVSRRFTFIQ